MPENQGYILDAAFVAALRAAVAKLNHISGDGVSSTPTGVTIGNRRRRPSRRSTEEAEVQWFFAQLTSVADGSGTYAWKEIQDTGAGAWQDVSGGRTSTTCARCKELHHRSTLASDAKGVMLALTAADGSTQYKLISDEWSRATPETVGFDTEGGATADTEAWTRDSDNEALDLWMVSRVFYDHTSGQILYAYVRKLQFDAGGRLYAVSGETRYEVDPTEACA